MSIAPRLPSLRAKVGSGEGSAGIVCARNQTFPPAVMVPRNILGEVYPSDSLGSRRSTGSLRR